MKKFLILYYGYEIPSSDSLKAWGTWFESLGAGLVDGGNPLGAGREVLRSGEVNSIGNTPHDPTGYSIVNAESLDAAQKLLEKCPAAHGARVYEARPM